MYFLLCRPNKKRQAKNARFGFGGQKKRSKYNTAESARDMSDYSVSKHGAGKKGKKVSCISASLLIP